MTAVTPRLRQDDANLAPGCARAVSHLARCVEETLAPAERRLLLYLGGQEGQFRDSGHTLRAQRVLWAAKELEVAHTLREAEWMWQTHAYLIWPQAAAVLLGALPCDAPVDVYMSRFYHERALTALLAEPPLAWQTSPYRGGDIVHSSLADREKMPGWNAAIERHERF